MIDPEVLLIALHFLSADHPCGGSNYAGQIN